MQNPGAALVAMRKIVDSNCWHCGKPIRGVKVKRYCDNRCRQAAKYQRQKSKLGDSEQS